MNAPNYGVDAPGVRRGFFLASVGLVLCGGFFLRQTARGPRIAGAALLASASPCLLLGSLMLLYGLRGKARMRDWLLSQIAWTGAETVLDVGTGRGFLAIGAAKRIVTGRVTGIDIWNLADLSGNTRDNALANALAEGSQVSFETADIRATELPSGSFDVVLSLLCLHNIEGKGGQARACREIARLLKPGGRALIADYLPTGGYRRAFAASGLQIEREQTRFSVALSLMWVVIARKPDSSTNQA